MLAVIQACRKLPLLLDIVSATGIIQAAPTSVAQGDAELAAQSLRKRLQRFSANPVCAVHREGLQKELAQLELRCRAGVRAYSV